VEREPNGNFHAWRNGAPEDSAIVDWTGNNVAVECCVSVERNLDNGNGKEFTEILAKGWDGVERQFFYTCKVEERQEDAPDPSLSRNLTHWEIHVWREDEDPKGVEAGYRAIAVAVGEFLAVSVGMFADREEFRKMGLPEAVIRELARRSGRTICSGSNYEGAQLVRGEYRGRDGEKPWRRLFDAKLASFDPTLDRFVYLGVAPNTSAAPDANPTSRGPSPVSL
jgi:hypothetical protein